MSLQPNELPRVPRLDATRARVVIDGIDRILALEQRIERARDQHFLELGDYLCEVRARQYWRLEQLRSFDEFLERRFPDSRRKAYYLMAVHEQLPPEVRPKLRQLGWGKSAQLARLARASGESFRAEEWVSRADAMTKQEVTDEVERILSGGAPERVDYLVFKLYKSQIPVIEKALDTAARLLGSDRSRGYCLEMICADFLAGAATCAADLELLLYALVRTIELLPSDARSELARRLNDVAEG